MNLRLRTFGLVVAASLTACGGSSGTAGGPAPPATPSLPAGPVPQQLVAYARAGMTEAEDAAPKPLNDVELVSNEDNASEFDDWFQ